MRGFQASGIREVLRRLKWPLALLALLVSAWLGRLALLPAAGRWLNVGEAPRPCDCVLVLPGGEETRPFVAAALVRAGLARQVLVPRGIGSPNTDEGIEPPAHEIIRRVLVMRGVPRSEIVLLGHDSQSTYTDATALRDFLLARPCSTVAIVTHDFHTRRARWIFRKVLGDQARHIYLLAAPHDKFNADNWWQSREGAATYCGEFAKLVGYLVWYGNTWVWTGAGLLLATTILLLYRRRRKNRGKFHVPPTAPL